ncbi:transporter [uncultured Eudoraea sp.]|uniref:transporter n=1 Tax=uncultured Eudoraea sp. TaxID=1035614 RepID=UPI00260D8A5C|nr:transporter [uncultured Eudoraea sp.]
MGFILRPLIHKSILIGFAILYFHQAYSQDIEPRRWSSIPLGTNIIAAGYAYTSGEVFFDPLLGAEDVTYRGNAFVAGYVRPFRLGNKLARVDVLLPFSFSRWEGLLNGITASAERNGLADPRIRLSLNLTGPPPSGPKELQEYRASHPVYTTLGVSCSVTLPFGQYSNSFLLNLGSNRFIIRPQLGMVHYWGPWSYELTSSVVFFTKNTNFFNGGELKQKALFALQTHLIRQFKKRFWASISAGYNQGASSIVNQQFNDDRRANFLGAASVGASFAGKQGLKLAYVYSKTLKDVGATTNTVLLSWSIAFK